MLKLLFQLVLLLGLVYAFGGPELRDSVGGLVGGVLGGGVAGLEHVGNTFRTAVQGG